MSDDPVLARARVAWRAEINRDDVNEADARVRRLLAGRQSESRGTAAWPALALACGVVFIAAAAATPEGDAPWLLGVDSERAVEVESSSSGPDETREAEATVPAVIAAPCFACVRSGGGGVSGGDWLKAGERIDVPAGASLLLCWGLETREVEGPADVVVAPTGEPTVHRPELRAMATPSPAVRAQRPEDSSREEPAEAARTAWREAQAALRAGDRARAERLLSAIVDVRGAPASLVERVSFALAELELAHGAVGEACARLRPLERSPDADLAADAVLLEARATSGARERSDVYARYLASAPPSPYREQAIAERGVALLEAGDGEGARACMRALQAEASVPGPVVPVLRRLERALAR